MQRFGIVGYVYVYVFQRSIFVVSTDKYDIYSRENRCDYVLKNKTRLDIIGIWEF